MHSVGTYISRQEIQRMFYHAESYTQHIMEYFLRGIHDPAWLTTADYLQIAPSLHQQQLEMRIHDHEPLTGSWEEDYILATGLRMRNAKRKGWDRRASTDDSLIGYVHREVRSLPYHSAKSFAFTPSGKRKSAAQRLLHVPSEMGWGDATNADSEIAINVVLNDLLDFDELFPLIKYFDTVHRSVANQHRMPHYMGTVGFYLRLWMLATMHKVVQDADTSQPVKWIRPLLIHEFVDQLTSQEVWLADFIRCITISVEGSEIRPLQF